MAKRFTATEIWLEDWFLEMEIEYKLLWYFMLSKCDHAGVWKPNKKTFEISTGFKINLEKALSFFNEGKERVMITTKNNWWIPDFFVFQYGTVFNINNKLHISIYNIYNQQDIDLRTNRGLKEVKWWSWSGLIEDFDTLKEKDKVILNKEEVKLNKNGQSKNYQQFRSVSSQGADLYAERIKRNEQAKAARNGKEDSSGETD